MLLTISKKWSKLSSREKEQFCPYVYLHNITQEELIGIKNNLQSEGFKFIDGFDFEGASFSQKSISEPINKTNPVKLKILNNLESMKSTLSEISKTKEIYQFYLTDEFLDANTDNIRHVKIQFSKLTDIEKII